MHVRKIITAIEEIYGEAGQPEETPLRKVAVIAIVKNPYAGKAYQEDLSSLTAASEALGVQITELANKAIQENWIIMNMNKTSPRLEDVFKFLTIGEDSSA